MNRSPRILLINPPPPEVNVHFLERADTYPPLALFHLAAALRAVSVQLEMIDLARHEIAETELVARTIAFDPDVVGLTAMVPNPSVLNIAHALKSARPQTRIVLGGAFPTSFPERILSSTGELFDIIVRGEGEEPITFLMTQLGKDVAFDDLKRDCAKQPGFATSLGGTLCVNKQYLGEALPTPRPYHTNSEWLVDYNRILLLASRGCPYDCKFCASTRFFGRRVRYQAVNTVVAEMAFLYHGYGKRSFSFLDDVFGINKKWFDEFLEELARADLPHLQFWIGTRAELMNPNIMIRAKRLGLAGVSFGLETIHKNTQESSGKRLDLDKYVEVFQTCKNLKIHIETGMMIGLPGETRQMIMQTIDFLDALDPDIVHVATLQLLPGTPFHDDMARYGFREERPMVRADEIFDPRSYIVGGGYFSAPWIDNDLVKEMKEYAADRLDLRMAEYRNRFYAKFGAAKLVSSWSTQSKHESIAQVAEV